MEVDFKGNLVPELAETWESSHDAAKWTFKLRKGEVVNQRLRYENPAGNWEMDGLRAAKRWWFQS